MNDFLQYTNRLQFHFWSIFCGQKVNFKWRSYQADRPLVFMNDTSSGIIKTTGCMVHNRVYGAQRGVWCTTGCMVHNGVYGAQRGVWCTTGCMVHNGVYGAQQGVWCTTGCMVHNGVYGAQRGVWCTTGPISGARSPG